MGVSPWYTCQPRSPKPRMRRQHAVCQSLGPGNQIRGRDLASADARADPTLSARPLTLAVPIPRVASRLSTLLTRGYPLSPSPRAAANSTTKLNCVTCRGHPVTCRGHPVTCRGHPTTSCLGSVQLPKMFLSGFSASRIPEYFHEFGRRTHVILAGESWSGKRLGGTPVAGGFGRGVLDGWP
jgi:hypothetical protein